MAREYILKNRGRGCNDHKMACDVIVAVNKAGNENKAKIQRYAVVVSFNPKIIKKITDTGYVRVSVDRVMMRMYFESGDNDSGYKVNSPKDCRRHYIRFTASDVRFYAKFVSDYMLGYDEHEQCYYIAAK